jgi:predicted AAA+ superfamily ATPase
MAQSWIYLKNFRTKNNSMEIFDRKLNIFSLLQRKSFFLFGPRATGKSTLVQTQLPGAYVFNLLDHEVFRELLIRPKLISERVLDPNKVVVIDEIQKIPALLDEVHRLIEERRLTFLLTGSSARKLRRGGANLLAGRAWEAKLFPLTSIELESAFDLATYLNRGGLPAIYGSEDYLEELNAYVSTYLSEEIQAEAVIKNLATFAEFLSLAALSNGCEINYDSMASDCAVSASTLKSYFQVLEDTLIGFKLPGFTKTTKRKAITRAKHYFFDIGVVNNLCRRGFIQEKSELFGNAFEHFIILEIRAYNSYARKNVPLSYWRSTSKFEVDIIIDGQIAVEIKASNLVTDKHLKGLRALKEEGILATFICVSQDSETRILDDGILVLPWREFLHKLWSGSLF